MGDKKLKLEDLPEPPQPKKTLFELFNVTPKRSMFDIFSKPTSETAMVPDDAKSPSEIKIEEIKTLPVPPRKKAKGFVYPSDPSHEEMQRRHLEQVDEMKSRLDQEYRERHAHVSDKEGSLEKIENKLVSRERNLFMMDSELKKLRAEIDSRIAYTKEKERGLSEREKMFNLTEKDYSEQNRIMEQKSEKLKKELENLNMLKLHLDSEIDIRKKKAEEMRKEYVEHLKILKDNEKLLSMREIEILRSVKQLEDDMRILGMKENDIVAKIKIVEDNKSTLKMKEEDVIKKIKALEGMKSKILAEREKMQKQISLQKDDMLKRQKASLQRVQEEYKKISEKKAEQEKLFKGRDMELRQREIGIKQLERDIRKREQKLDTAKEINENITKLRSTYDGLVKQYSDLKRDFLKAQSLAQKEQELIKMKADLLTKEKMLSAIDEKLKQRKHVVDDLEYTTYFSRFSRPSEPKPEPLPDRVEKPVQAQKSVQEENDIFRLMEQTKMMVHQGYMEDAKSNIRRIKKLFSDLRMDKDKKSAVYYDILEIQNEIEIASL